MIMTSLWIAMIILAIGLCVNVVAIRRHRRYLLELEARLQLFQELYLADAHDRARSDLMDILTRDDPRLRDRVLGKLQDERREGT